MFPWNYELVVLIDDTRNIEIIGYFTGKAQSTSRLVSSWDELNALLSEAQFTTHQLVVRPDDEYHPEYRKGIKDLGSLKEAFTWATKLSKKGNVFVENDLRAHTNPTRMANIFKATEDLSRKMNSVCLGCESPGLWVAERQRGLPCADCETPTTLPIANIWSCIKCGYTQKEMMADQTKADPSKCNYCNP